uniref:Uncharacterized protein n=1 Tax=Rhizophora mucronata TaxID=61149 RepID=A0A2P2QDJ9_RHIMU
MFFGRNYFITHLSNPKVKRPPLSLWIHCFGSISCPYDSKII